MREVIDKTASFVAKNGADFEIRMMRESNALERFGFLFPGHAYRAYYEIKVKEVQRGRVETVHTAVPQAVADMWQKENERQQKVLMLKGHSEREEEYANFEDVAAELEAQAAARAINDGVKDNGNTDPQRLANGSHSIPPPPPQKFVLKHPYIAPIDSDVIKLIAQFVACNGHTFLAELTQRERSNPQFEFLRPHHPTHSYFNDLVESYVKCLSPSESLIGELSLIASDNGIISNGTINTTTTDDDDDERCLAEERRTRLLAYRMHKRYQWEAEQEAKKRATEEADAEERAAMAAIDWDDFVVVETIVFSEADATGGATLPTPVNYSTEIDGELAAPQPMQETDSSASKVVSVSAPPPPSFESAPSGPAVGSVGPVIGPSRLEVPLTTTTTVDGAPTKIVLRPDYVRRSKRSAAVGGGRYLKCPITGQLVPAEEMTQHLKILLIDSKWKKQKDDLLARAQKESAYAPEVDVETNIAQFVMKRPDLFGTVEDEILEHASDPLAGTGVPPPALTTRTGRDESNKKTRYS